MKRSSRPAAADATPAADPLTAHQRTARCKLALRARFDEKAYAFFTEVPDGIGGSKRRSMDAVALSLHPSRGLHFHGCEIKVDRGDWLRELHAPDKAEAILRFCHFAWLVVGHDAVVKIDEVPAGWGLLLLKPDGTLKKVKDAPERKPEMVTMDFLAGLLRRAAQASTDPAVLHEAVDAAFERGRAFEKTEATLKVDRARQELAQMQREMDAFCAATGMTRLAGTGAGARYGAAVVALEHRGLAVAERQLAMAVNMASRMVQEITPTLESVRAALAEEEAAETVAQAATKAAVLAAAETAARNAETIRQFEASIAAQTAALEGQGLGPDEIERVNAPLQAFLAGLREEAAALQRGGRGAA